MSKVFLIDINRCNGCRNCQIACKDEHCEQAWLPTSESQPLTGQFWMNVKEKVRGQVPVVRVAYTPTFCTHCEQAPCAAVGGDAVYTRDDGLVIIDPHKARGKRELVDSCPLGAIYYNEELDLPQKCAGCAHLLDDGWSVPRCVDACATEALLYVNEDEVDSSRAAFLPETAGSGPRVYYYNLPKRFIAGTIVDFSADEVVIGTRVDLLDTEGRLVESTVTDEFGDFRFNQIEPLVYHVAFVDSPTAGPLVVDVQKEDICVGDVSIL